MLSHIDILFFFFLQRLYLTLQPLSGRILRRLSCRDVRDCCHSGTECTRDMIEEEEEEFIQLFEKTVKLVSILVQQCTVSNCTVKRFHDHDSMI